MGGGGSRPQKPPVQEAAPALPPIRSIQQPPENRNTFNPNVTASFSAPHSGMGGVSSIGGMGLPQPPPHMIAKKAEVRRPSFEYASSYVGAAPSMSYPPPRNPGTTPAQGVRRDRTNTSNTLQPRKNTGPSASISHRKSLSPTPSLKQEDSMDKIDSNFDVGSSTISGRDRPRSQADRFYEQYGNKNSAKGEDISTSSLLKMMAELGEPNAKSGTSATPHYPNSDFSSGDGTPNFAVTVPFLRLEELKEPQPTRELKRTNSREKVIANTNHKPQQAQHQQPLQRRTGQSILDEPLPKINKFDNTKFRAFNNNLKKKAAQKPETIFQATYSYDDVNSISTQSTHSLSSTQSLALSSSEIDSSSPPTTPPTPTPQDYTKLPLFGGLPNIRHNSPVPAPAFDEFEEELMNSLFQGSEPNSGILAR